MARPFDDIRDVDGYSRLWDLTSEDEHTIRTALVRFADYRHSAIKQGANEVGMDHLLKLIRVFEDVTR